ncbi:MAG: DUF4143 domain-containing protein [Atopobiaceae bacterium]|jgi:predicted AAA+ superfamily ATPase|nr:ATP-binding protein [Atopobiaceae bacterium]MCH4181336.1 ATP-binding protein [Atopobiaceae bacterium]MCH4213509.1 ATP-binding protein [Atopobiaceae bacterium]MCH4229731.1 ATP-binding protein [Atopobiaceae bacterium]MCH4276156.1 ATP-binding protein [Atopobiaceae bacterium]
MAYGNQHSIKPTGYLSRIVDAEVDECLETYGATEIAGTKWCGKTWTAREHASSIIYLDEGQNLAMAQADPTSVLEGASPHVIDEWQLAPRIWDTVRHAVDDAGRTRGLWILAGSSTPHKDEVHHSGAGRFGRVRMLPMTLQESGDSTGDVSLAGLFEGKFERVHCDMDIKRLISLCCRGGWPETIDLPPARAQRIARDYLEATFQQSVPAQGGRPDVARRLLLSLSRNLGQFVTYKVLARDMYGDEDADAMLSPRMASRYIELLESLYVIEPVRGWAPPARSPKRFQTKERRYLADPSLAVAALQMSERSLRDDWQTFGLVFENLCMRDLIVYGRALPDASASPVHYYRDDSGLEADAIIEKADGTWAAIEVNLGEDKVEEAATHLKRLQAKVVGNKASHTVPPSFLGVLVGLGKQAYQREDGVYVIPIGCLGA